MLIETRLVLKLEFIWRGSEETDKGCGVLDLGGL